MPFLLSHLPATFHWDVMNICTAMSLHALCKSASRWCYWLCHIDQDNLVHVQTCLYICNARADSKQLRSSCKLGCCYNDSLAVIKCCRYSNEIWTKRKGEKKGIKSLTSLSSTSIHSHNQLSSCPGLNCQRYLKQGYASVGAPMQMLFGKLSYWLKSWSTIEVRHFPLWLVLPLNLFLRL